MPPHTTRSFGLGTLHLACRTTAVIEKPAAMPCETICLPMQPLAPSTKIFMVSRAREHIRCRGAQSEHHFLRR